MLIDLHSETGFPKTIVEPEAIRSRKNLTFQPTSKRFVARRESTAWSIF